MIQVLKYYLTLFILFFLLFCDAQVASNKFRIFIGVGDNNIVSDVVTLTDKSFLGEISGQVRGGIRLYENYELNVGTYFRKYPSISKYPGLSYNKFLGFSAAFMHEYRKQNSHWGLPLGIEFLKYNRNLDSALNDGNGTVYTDHYQALCFGPKIGLRYHISKNFFLESELELLYEKYKWKVDWVDKSSVEANRFSSFKFFGISANLSF